MEGSVICFPKVDVFEIRRLDPPSPEVFAPVSYRKETASALFTQAGFTALSARRTFSAFPRSVFEV